MNKVVKVIDIESNDLLANMLDFSSLPYKLNKEAKLHCVVIRDAHTNEVVKATSVDGFSKEWFEKHLSGVDEIVAHNGIKFDLIALKLFGLLDYEVGYIGKSDKLFGRDVKITDTLIRSRLFNPDRYGGHGLAAWGKRIGNFKDDFRQQSIDLGLIPSNAPKGAEFRVYSPLMLEYCIQDTNVTKDVHHILEKEFIEYSGWHIAEKQENKLADLAIRRESYGFYFDKELAIKNLEFLMSEMSRLEASVNPHLPKKKLGKTALKHFTPPAKQFLMSGELNSHMTKFIERHGMVKVGDRQYEYCGEVFDLPIQHPIQYTTEASISDLDHVKEYLISLGWNPTEWKVRDLTKDSKKQTLSYQKRLEALDRWLNQTFDEGRYKKHRLEELDLGESKSEIRAKLAAKLKKDRPVRVPTSPSVRVGLEKELCKNLTVLGDAVSFAKDFTLYLTYKHRKSSIAGGAIEDMDFDEEYPNTGYLAMYREVDQRIPTPAIEIGAATNRYRHIGVCNVPRASSIMGKEMRSLFGCGEGMIQFGFDFSGLEANIQGHYVIPFDGLELAKQLLASKPNDVHCYSEDTEILTKRGWKTFGNLDDSDVVAQYQDGYISFVQPSDIVWQQYSGDMYVDPVTNFKVTPNHRVMYQSYSSGKEDVVRAEHFVPSRNNRFIVAGKLDDGDGLLLDENLVKLIVATQADGHLHTDSSAITFCFKKQRKVSRLTSILDNLSAKYSISSYSRASGIETVVRVKASDLTLKVRSFLNHAKGFSDLLLGLNVSNMVTFVSEVGHWDGTVRDNGDIVLDTTDFESCDMVQTLASLIGMKTSVSEYTKKTSFGCCSIKRVYISVKSSAKRYADKELGVVKYSGMIGCVSVPSGLVLTKRGNSIVVSGNTITAKKMGLIRDLAKSISYMLMYGGSAARARAMLGCSKQEAEKVVDDYWKAVPALKRLKDAVVRVWKARGSKYLVGVDGRKINTRSEHSLLNAIFQSGGVINAKYVTVYAFEIFESLGFRCDPFTDSVLDVCGMIEYHDENQLAVNPDLITYEIFETEEGAKEFVKKTDGQCGSIFEDDRGWVVPLPNVISETILTAIKRAEEATKLKVNLSIEWVVGNNWYDCH